MRWALVFLLALTACEKQYHSEAEIEDIAADAAADVVSPRVEELNSKLEELEERIEELDNREKQLTNATIEDLATLNRRVTDFQETYNRHTH